LFEFHAVMIADHGKQSVNKEDLRPARSGSILASITGGFAMPLSKAPLLSLCLLASVVPGVAEAQEYGVIVGTVTPGVGAQARGLGAATAGAIGQAANAVAAVNQRAGSSAQGSGARSGPRRIDVHRFTSLPVGDPLEGSDAPTYAFANGRTLRVSGSFLPAAQPFGAVQWCLLEYGAINVTGGYAPSGPPRDDCRNIRS
jgi:hypothetical protein